MWGQPPSAVLGPKARRFWPLLFGWQHPSVSWIKKDQIAAQLKPCHSDRSFAFPQGKGSAVEEPAVPDRAMKIVAGTLFHPKLVFPNEQPPAHLSWRKSTWGQPPSAV